MSGPPDDIAPSELWAALMQLPRPSKDVDFPGKDPGGNPIGKLKMVVLTQAEHMVCIAAADKVAKELIKEAKKDEPTLAFDNLFHNAASVEVLARACRDFNDVERPAFPSPKQIRTKFTADQIGQLTRQYLQTQAELGPIVAWMTREEEDAWVAKLAEGGSVFPISFLSVEAQDRLLLSLACRLQKFLTAMSSAGSQLDESSTSSADADEFASADNTPEGPPETT